MLEKIQENIWVHQGSIVNFYGLPYSTRMTVIRLPQNALWIHSAENLSKELVAELANLGEVKYLVTPNKLHHLFLPQWIEAYPLARLYAPPGLRRKREDIQFTRELQSSAEAEWQSDISQIIFQGSPLMEEVVFFHHASKTLILTDLIENFNPAVFNWWQTILAYFTGVLSPHGKTPVDWRFSFVFGKAKARKVLAIMKSWQPENIIISHGECIWGDGARFLDKSFSWLE